MLKPWWLNSWRLLHSLLFPFNSLTYWPQCSRELQICFIYLLAFSPLVTIAWLQNQFFWRFCQTTSWFMVSADKPDFNPLPGLPPSPLCHFTSRGGYPFFLKKKREREKKFVLLNISKSLQIQNQVGWLWIPYNHPNDCLSVFFLAAISIFYVTPVKHSQQEDRWLRWAPTRLVPAHILCSRARENVGSGEECLFSNNHIHA